MPLNFCPNCGGELQFKEAEICPNCGVRIREPPQPPQEKYAGFWIRFGAYLIDAIICAIIVYGVLFVLILAGIAISPATYSRSTPGTNGAIGALLVIWILFALCFNWIYFAYQESSSVQATIGKRAVGVIVTDTEGNRISFGRASARWLAKILSGLILGIGYIMIGFTERKQGLHDLIDNTYVVYKDRQ